jgi:hypothetical protein
MNSLEKCKIVIEACIAFKNSVDIIEENEKLSKKVMSILGEYYVLRQLLSTEFPNAIHKGGHGSYDIEIPNKPPMKIEVKTSTLKQDSRIFKGKIWTWGWTVETKKQAEKKDAKKPRFHYLVTVALDKSWTQPEFYIFSYDETAKIFCLDYPDDKIPIHASISKRILAFQNRDDFENALSIGMQNANKYDFISPLDIAVFEKPGDFKDNWKKLYLYRIRESENLRDLSHISSRKCRNK